LSAGRIRRAVPVLVLSLHGPAWLPAAPADQRPRPTFAVGTERVTVDFVVRDKKDAVLRGLTAADVEVWEDGVRQEVESLEFVERLALDDAALSGTAPPPAFVAVAFDRLGPSARNFARDAVRATLGDALPPSTWVGVFSIDQVLAPLQPFTTDRDAVRDAVEKSLAPISYAGVRDRDKVRKAWGGLASGFGQSHVASAEFSAEPECRAAEDDVTRRMKIMDSRMVEGFDALERDQQGYATTHALLALIGALQALPGRKALLLFSEGLAVPADVEASFLSVVSAANRANVSIYAADAAGLRAASTADETRRAIASLQTRLELQQGGGNPAARGASAQEDPTSGLALLERNEDTLRLAPGSGLGRLAEATGGVLMEDTNDISSGLLEMGEDLGAYYQLSYSPRNADFDGRFRTITMKIKRPHGRLQARKGYLAVRTPMPVPALDYEAPALARLDGRPSADAVPLRVGALQFPEEPPFSVAPVLVEVPARGTQDLTVLVLVRDESGDIVAKMSQRYPGARGPVLFYREASLPAGTYALQAVAYDARSGASGTATTALEVPASSPAELRASSLMIVGNVEKLGAGDAAAARPLTYGGVLLYPNLGEPVRRAAGRTLTYFLTAWPAADRPAVEARVEVARDGRIVVTTPTARLQPDADGRIQLASTLPVDALAPGTYELRVHLRDGRSEETRTVLVPIAP
jgi:VWFA-related protein